MPEADTSQNFLTSQSTEGARIIRAAVTWVDTARKNGYGGKGWVPTDADIWHSSLLVRLLEGKELLPEPPPKAYSYPWYDLIENGAAYFIPEQLSEWFETDNYPDQLVICASPGWHIMKRLDPGYVLAHVRAPGAWELRPLREDEDHPQRGTDMRTGPILATWVLTRV